MMTIDRSPLSNDDTDGPPAVSEMVARISDSLAELEAKAWIIDNRIAAVLIGAARIALRES